MSAFNDHPIHDLIRKADRVSVLANGPSAPCIRPMVRCNQLSKSARSKPDVHFCSSCKAHYYACKVTTLLRQTRHVVGSGDAPIHAPIDVSAAVRDSFD